MSGARVERRLAANSAADAAGCSRHMGEDDAGTLVRLAGVAHAMCDVSNELVDLGRICDASELGVVIGVTALPLSPPASRINAEDPDLVPRLAGVGDDYKLVSRRRRTRTRRSNVFRPSWRCRSPQPAQ